MMAETLEEQLATARERLATERCMREVAERELKRQNERIGELERELRRQNERIAELQGRLGAERQAREAVEARLYAGCQDCIYEPRNRCPDQCSGCTIWTALVTAGIEHE